MDCPVCRAPGMCVCDDPPPIRETADDECGDCGGKVSAEDETCPHCGAA